MKKCSACNKEKQFSQFNLNKDGDYTKFCISCLEYNKEYRKNNKEYIRKYYEDRKQLFKARNRKYYQEHIELSKEYYQRNKESIKKQKKHYYYNNKELINKKAAKRHKDRLKSDPNYKLRHSLRCRLNRAIKNDYKSGSAVSDLGCTIEEFKVYLESKFYDHPETKEKMTWDNWTITGWHIDHIKSLSSFNLENREEFLKACHYTNLQPLWAEHNLDKRFELNHE